MWKLIIGFFVGLELFTFYSEPRWQISLLLAVGVIATLLFKELSSDSVFYGGRGSSSNRSSEHN